LVLSLKKEKAPIFCWGFFVACLASFSSGDIFPKIWEDCLLVSHCRVIFHPLARRAGYLYVKAKTKLALTTYLLIKYEVGEQ
jgi:hypothetical protein